MIRLKTPLKTLCALVSLATLALFLPFCFAASPETIISDYSVSASEIYENQTMSVTFSLKNVAIKTNELSGKDDIEVTHVTDGFSGTGSPKVSVTSSANEYLSYNITFTKMLYKGGSNVFSFAVFYDGVSSESEILSAVITECSAASDEPVLPTEGTGETNPVLMPTNAQTTPEVPDVPDVSQAEPEAPSVWISREKIAKTLGAGDKFELSLVFGNAGSAYPITGGTATFEPSDSLILDEYSSSKFVPEIRPGASKSVPLKLKVAKEVASSAQSVTVTLDFSYQTPDGVFRATKSEKINVPVSVSSQSEKDAQNATPNIIITDYSYGGDAVAAGDDFTLSLTFKNTSEKLGIDNIKMTVEPGEALNVSSSSNSFYFSSLGASQSKTQTIKMSVPSSAISSGASLGISFAYEYIDAGTRGNGTSTETLSIPIVLPDRFNVTPPDAIFGVANEEVAISLTYSNKSRSVIYNTEAVIEYDDGAMYCELPSQSIGNIDPGKTGSIDFYVTPSTEGEAKVKIIVTYENEAEEKKTVEVPVSFNVDPPMDYGFEEIVTDEGEEQGGKTVSKWIIAAAVVVVLIVLFIIIKRRRKKKKKAAAEMPQDFNWALEPDTQSQIPASPVQQNTAPVQQNTAPEETAATR